MSEAVQIALIAAGPGVIGAIVGAAVPSRRLIERLVRLEEKVNGVVTRLVRVEDKLDRR